MKSARLLPFHKHSKSIFYLHMGTNRGHNGPVMPKRALKLEPPAKTRKPPSGSYAPRLRKDSREVKFRASSSLNEQIEAEAMRYNMSKSNYLQLAIRTFISEGRTPKLSPRDE